MLEEIQNYIKETKPDGIVSRLKAVPQFWNEILTYSNKFNCSNKSEMIYLYLNQTIPPICACGSESKPKFVSIILGYREFCKSNCSAASKHRTKTIKASGSKLGLAKEGVRERVTKTLLEKYGVVNIGQVQSNKDNMKINNPMFSEKVRQKVENHYLTKYGVFNPSQKHIDSDVLTILTDKNKLEAKLRSSTLSELAIQFNIRYSYLRNKCLEYGLIDKKTFVPEAEIKKWLLDNNINFLNNTRKIIHPYELDFYLPDHNIAIEYCGLYWHSEKVLKDNNYHYKKYDKCKNKGIRLITIFEDEYLDKPFVVYSTLKNLINNNSDKIFARKCSIVELTTKEVDLFYDRTHIMGAVGTATKNYGLMYNNELHACMSFKNMGKQVYNRHKQISNNSWSLTRFSSKIRVVGGASRLLNHFTLNNSFDLIITYADLRWSDGNLYNKLGFIDDGFDPPQYWYIKNQKRYHKFGFRKGILKNHGVDTINYTEKEIVENLGYDRIWDCGRLRYLMK